MFQKSLQLGLYLSLLSIPMIEQVNSPVMAQSINSYINNYQQQAVIRKNTPILITLADTIAIDVKNKETIPTTAILSEALSDTQGRQLASQGSAVAIILKPIDKKTGVVYADSIMTGQINIAIKASSEEIVSRKIKLEKNSHSIAEHGQIGSAFGSSIGTALAPSGTYDSNNSNSLNTEEKRLESVNNAQKRLETQDQYSAIGGLVGGLIGLASGGETVRLVELKAGHTLVLKLEEDAIVNLPSNYVPQSNPNLANHNYQPQNLQVSNSNNNGHYNSNSNTYNKQNQEQLTNNFGNQSTGSQLVNVFNSGAANNSIYRISGQPISPSTMARLRSFLAGNNLAEASCGATTQQVTIRVNNEFTLCGHPNGKYSPGNYSITLNGLY